MRNLIPSYIRIPVTFFLIFGLIEYLVDSGDKPAFVEYPIVLLFLILILLVLIAIEGSVAALENVLYQSLDEEGKERFNENKTKVPKLKWARKLYYRLTDSVPVEDEGEIILDHNYDGIRELDNSLPPWWLYGFYISIIFAAIYLLRYHVFDGALQEEEFNQEMADAKLAIEEYKKHAKDLVDFNTVELLTDPNDLTNGRGIFNTNCVACHMQDGGGGIGPNLTDNYWILGGGIKNVFKTISEGGRSGKGMVAWKQSLKPSEIAQVASYVISLEGTIPANPKEPQGELWEDETVGETKKPAEEESNTKPIDTLQTEN